MADTAINRVLFPQNVSIDDLSIKTTNGQIFNVKRLLVDFSYFEDIYSFSISGYVTLRDATGIIENLGLTGKETIIIDFDIITGGRRKPQEFRLYSIPSRKPIGPMNSEFIKLYFCSEELLLSEQTKVTKSYSDTVSNIITNILTTKLKITKPYDIQSTVGTYNFNVPTLKPFEAISWLSLYARPSNNNLIGADMFFYETRNGYNFKSLSTLYNQPVYRTYKYQQQNLSPEKQPLDEDAITVLDFEFIKAFNALEDINSGTFANRLISLDVLTRNAKITDFDYNNYAGDKLNSGTILNDVQNRFGKTPNQMYTGKLKLVTSNSEQKKKENIDSNGVAQDIFIETTVPNRTAQIALSNYTVIKLRIPIDPYLTAGSIIYFDLPSISGGKDKLPDRYYSGRYLVTAVRHVMKSEGGNQTILEITKDSAPTAASVPTSITNDTGNTLF